MYLIKYINAEIVARRKCRRSRANFFTSAIISSQDKFCFYRYSQRKLVQEFVKMKSWLLLIFSVCLHNQLKFHNSRILGIRRTPGSRGIPGSPRKLVPPWDPRTPGFPGTSMVPVSTRILGCSKYAAVRIPR